MKGTYWALCSVVLVAVAQLLLRYAIVSLPPVNDLPHFFVALLHLAPGSGALVLGLTGYIASMGCWYLALHRMALSKAYALLSLSYILVWAMDMVLPGGGDFSWQALAGIFFIMFGVRTIFLPAPRKASR